jgi:RNA polymerase-binding transcription factor DksA
MKKLDVAREEFTTLQKNLRDGNENGTDSTNNNYLTLDDGADTFEKENTTQLAARLMKFIQNLEAAMVRIENKTYGVCKTTGKLIPKERLRAVPHTTQTIEAKLSK